MISSAQFSEKGTRFSSMWRSCITFNTPENFGGDKEYEKVNFKISSSQKDASITPVSGL